MVRILDDGNVNHIFFKIYIELTIFFFLEVQIPLFLNLFGMNHFFILIHIKPTKEGPIRLGMALG